MQPFVLATALVVLFSACVGCFMSTARDILANIQGRSNPSSKIWAMWLHREYSWDLTNEELSLLSTVLENLCFEMPSNDKPIYGSLNMWWRFLTTVLADRALVIEQSSHADRQAPVSPTQSLSIKRTSGRELLASLQLFEAFKTVLHKLMPLVIHDRTMWLSILARQAIETGQNDVLAHLIAFGRFYFMGAARFTPESDLLYTLALKSENRVLLHDLTNIDGFFATIPLRGVRAIGLLMMFAENLSSNDVRDLVNGSMGDESGIAQSVVLREDGSSMHSDDTCSDDLGLMPIRALSFTPRLEREDDISTSKVIVRNATLKHSRKSSISEMGHFSQIDVNKHTNQLLVNAHLHLTAREKLTFVSAMVDRMEPMHLVAALQVAFDASLEQNGWRGFSPFAPALASYFYVRIVSLRHSKWRSDVTARQCAIFDAFGRALADKDGIESLVNVLTYKGSGIFDTIIRANVVVVDRVGEEGLISVRSARPTQPNGGESRNVEQLFLKRPEMLRKETASTAFSTNSDSPIEGLALMHEECALCHTEILKTDPNALLVYSHAAIDAETASSRARRSQRDDSSRHDSVLSRSFKAFGLGGSSKSNAGDIEEPSGSGKGKSLFFASSHFDSTKSSEDAGIEPMRSGKSFPILNMHKTSAKTSPRTESSPRAALFQSLHAKLSPRYASEHVADGHRPQPATHEMTSLQLKRDAKVHPNDEKAFGEFTQHSSCGAQYHSECASQLPSGLCVRCGKAFATDLVE